MLGFRQYILTNTRISDVYVPASSPDTIARVETVVFKELGCRRGTMPSLETAVTTAPASPSGLITIVETDVS